MTSSKLLRLLIAAGSVGALVASTGIRADAASSPSLSWTTAAPPSSPPDLTYAAGAYDPSTGTFVLFGGIGADGAMSGATWVWDGHTWSEPPEASQNGGGPSPRDLAAVGYDARLNQFVLFGGQTAQGNLLSDTWTWNGYSWYQLAPSLPEPTPRDGATLAYDRDGRLVLFGGTGYATPTGAAPVGASAGVASAEKALGDTWLYQGATSGWTQDKVSGPPPRSGAFSAYDEQNGTTVVFGGDSAPASASEEPVLLDDTWIWNGSSWARAEPSTSPPARFASVGDDFGPLGGPLVAGGYGANGDLSDTWLWQGDDWTEIADRGADPGRQGAAGGFDTATGDLVVFGGTSGGGALAATSLARLPAAPLPPATTTTVIETAPTNVVPRKPGTTTTTTTRAGGRAPTRTSVPSRPVKPSTGLAVTPSAPALEAAGARVAQGGRLALRGSGFVPGTTVSLTLHSAPVQLGSALVGRGGGFALTVAVPATAPTGTHQVLASEPSPDGGLLTASTKVSVYAATRGLSAMAKVFLLGLALLVPVATYAVMLVHGWWRDRRRRALTAPANAPRSPS